MRPKFTTLWIIALLGMTFPMLCGAISSTPKVVRLSVRICDKLNHRIIPGGMMELYRMPDTVKVKTTSGRMDAVNGYGCNATITPGKYLVGAFVKSEPGETAYEPEWRVVEFTQKQIDGFDIILPAMYVGKRMERALDEVTVTPSKIKFYHNGDTLIYNADAFVLAEGSMLDALIEQLPGVELGKNGVIKCRGRVVKELLLNGKNLFDGNNELMLENLPAYTVKSVKVYDARSDKERLLDMNLMESKYTMDVRLKREYAMGWMVNAEAGDGSHGRWLGRLFGLWFADNVSATAYAGMNNLSDNSRPGKDAGTWNRESMGTGVKTHVYGGVRYTADGFEDKWKLNGNVDVVRDKEDARSQRLQQLYLNGGDTYLRNRIGTVIKNMKVNTQHYINLRFGNRATLKGHLTFEHNDGAKHMDLLEATLDKDIKDLSFGMLENAYAGGDSLWKHVVNRRREMTKTEQNATSGRISVWSDIKLKGTGYKQLLYAQMDGSFGERSVASFNRMGIDYFKSAIRDERSYDRYTKSSPNRDNGYKGILKFEQMLSTYNPDHISIWYEYSHKTELMTSETYNLNHMPDYDAMNPGFGYLPSWAEYGGTFDALQSYRGKQNTTSQVIKPELMLIWAKTMKFYPIFMMSMPITIMDRTLDYDGRGIKSTLKRNELMSGLDMNLSFVMMHMWLSGNIHFTSTPYAAPMLSLLDVVDNTDPLNIRLGNPTLRRSQKNTLTASLKYHPTRKRWKHNWAFNLNAIENAIGQGYYYNSDTGVRIYKPYNVDGNRDMSGSYEINVSLGPSKQWELSAKTEASNTRSIDLAGSYTGNTVDMDVAPPQRKVVTKGLMETLKGSVDIGKHRASANAEIKGWRYEGRDAGFEDFTSWTGRFGASWVLNLPRNWGVSTDLTLYMRRGFTDRRLNTQDVVWNARVTKSLLKGSVVVAVDGYDLLRQLTNITYTINAQARTETVSNVIPAYVLVHVQWRWNKQPKR